MTEQELRNSLHRAMNVRLSGMQEDPWLAQRILNQPKGEKKMKRFTVQTVLAMILLLAIMGTVYAATLSSAPDDLIDNTPLPASGGTGEVDQWVMVEKAERETEQQPMKLNDYWQYWTNDALLYNEYMSVASIDTGFNQNLEMELKGIRFRLRDAYISDNRLYTVTEISCVDGSPSVFVESPQEKEKLPKMEFKELYLDQYNKGFTISAMEYIEKKDYPVYIANADLFYGHLATSRSFREGNGKMIVVNTHEIPSHDDTACVQWRGMVWDEEMQKWISVSMPVNLTAKLVEEMNIAVDRVLSAGDAELEVQSVSIRKTDIDVEVDFHCRLLQPTDEKWEQINEFAFYAVDTNTWQYLKAGSDIHGGMVNEINKDTGEFSYKRATLSLEDYNERNHLSFQLLPYEVFGKGDPQQPTIDVKIK